MLNLLGGLNGRQDPDWAPMSRRSFLKIGGMAAGGLSLSNLLSLEAQAGTGGGHPREDDEAIEVGRHVVGPRDLDEQALLVVAAGEPAEQEGDARGARRGEGRHARGLLGEGGRWAVGLQYRPHRRPVGPRSDDARNASIAVVWVPVRARQRPPFNGRADRNHGAWKSATLASARLGLKMIRTAPRKNRLPV